jgi:hypothetical protein
VRWLDGKSRIDTAGGDGKVCVRRALQARVVAAADPGNTFASSLNSSAFNVGIATLPGVYQEARRRGVEVVAVPTEEACGLLSDVGPRDAAAVIHVTC